MKLRSRNEERECNLIRSETDIWVDLVTLKLKWKRGIRGWNACESSITCVCISRYQLRNGGCSPNKHRPWRKTLIASIVCCWTSATSLPGSAFPHDFCMTSSNSTLLMGELLTGWRCGSMWDSGVAVQGCRVPWSRVCSIALCLGQCLHPSFAFNIVATVLVMPVVCGSSCHTATVGLLGACSVHRAWGWWINAIQTGCYLCFESQGRAGKRTLG